MSKKPLPGKPEAAEADIRPLTKGRLQSIQAKIRPGMFLRTYAAKLDEHGETMLEGLFLIASGQVEDCKIADRLSAIRLIMEMGAFKEVAKTLLKIATKGRPTDGSESEIPEWAEEYGAAEAADAHPSIEVEDE